MSTLELMSISKDIRQYLDEERINRKLTFIEDTHEYGIFDPITESVVNHFPSVSSLIKEYSIPFDDIIKSLQMCNEDEVRAAELRKTWQAKGDYANNVGSYVHYKLENYILELFDIDKKTRKPEYVLDNKSIIEGQRMVKTGINLMHTIIEKGFVPLDTEVIMGSTTMKYFGQCDNLWLGFMNNTIVFLMTDHKTNQSKNFKVRPWNVPMLKPFSYLMDTDLSKYFLQQPLYALLLEDMLKDSPFSNYKFAGFRVIHLRDDGQLYKIPKQVYTDIKNIYWKN